MNYLTSALAVDAVVMAASTGLVYAAAGLIGIALSVAALLYSAR